MSSSNIYMILQSYMQITSGYTVISEKWNHETTFDLQSLCTKTKRHFPYFKLIHITSTILDVELLQVFCCASLLPKFRQPIGDYLSEKQISSITICLLSHTGSYVFWLLLTWLLDVTFLLCLTFFTYASISCCIFLGLISPDLLWQI